MDAPLLYVAGLVLGALLLGFAMGGVVGLHQRFHTRPPSAEPPLRHSEVRCAPPRWPVLRGTGAARTLRLVVPAEHARARLRSLVRCAVRAIEQAPVGERLHTLHARCLAVGQHLDAAEMLVADVAPALEAAALTAEQDPKLVRLVLEAGRRAPRGFLERDHG